MTELREAANVAEWIESRLHLSLTAIADEMFGDGKLTREERIALSSAVGDALTAFHDALMAKMPSLFQRKPWREVEDQYGELSEAGRLTGDVMALAEAAVRADGTVPLKIVAPGWGTSGYYPADVLERDGPGVFRAGTHMYWDHPTLSEEAERPERSLRDLAAVLVSDARWWADGLLGPGLYADAKVFGDYAEALDEMAPHIGVSLRALGRVENGVVDGREGPIVQALLSGESIDFVTHPGAGGAIVQMFESARRGVRSERTKDAGGPTHITEVDNMSEQQMEALRAQIAELEERANDLANANEALTEQNRRLHETLMLREAAEVVNATLSGIEMPEPTRQRLAEAHAGRPVIIDGELDREATAQQVREAAEAELAYLAEVAPVGRISGMGPSVTTSTPNLEEARRRQHDALAAMGYARNGGTA